MDTITSYTRYKIFTVFNNIFKNKISTIENMTNIYGCNKKQLLKSSNQFNDIIFVEIYRDDNDIERFINIINLIFRLSIYLETVINVLYTKDDKSYISSMIEKIILIIDDEYRYYWDR